MYVCVSEWVNMTVKHVGWSIRPEKHNINTVHLLFDFEGLSYLSTGIVINLATMFIE